MPGSWADIQLDQWQGFDPPLPAIRHGRAQLRAYCRESTTPPMHAYIAVMAWGQQSPKSGRYREDLRAKKDAIADLVRKTREEMPRADAYDLWRKAKVWGLGPSFFTKLLAFLCPNENMAIMDQWAVKSVNILYNTEVIRLTANSPCSSNKGLDYERYCCCLENLQSLLNEKTISSTEERIFSRLIEGRDTWRSYVKETWKPEVGRRRRE